MPIADAPVIEIVEKDVTTIDKHGSATVIVPNDVRINGQSLLCCSDHPVTVHEISMSNPNVVLVTLTLFARRVIIGAEND
jgi:hypothetical protein